jgi:carbon starvation protein
MNLLFIVSLSALVLLLGYKFYGALLKHLFKLDPNFRTPAVEYCDDVDYIPTDPKFLFGQHFSAIAAAGPIVGPILAGYMFGWIPALLWILLGSIFVGGVHDFSAIIASVRHKACSIAELVKQYMTKRAYFLFLAFVWIAIVYIVVAFTDIVAKSFVGIQKLESGAEIRGGATATSSMLYLSLPIIMALLMRFLKLRLWLATAIFLPLVGVSIWVGPYIPLDIATIFGISDDTAAKVWIVFLLVYCGVASVIPMWLLLQPRGHLGGFFLIFALIGGLLGVVLGGKPISYPAFLGFSTAKGEPMFPLLIITVACGACSGFHALVASGTTSKQLRKETDAIPVGYGGMLMEGMVAVVSLACVMMFAQNASVFQGEIKANLIYGIGMGNFLEVIGIPAAFGISFGLLAFATFVYDTLDVSTRLGRYVFQELIGWKNNIGKIVATFITVATPFVFVMQTTTDAKGNVIPAWKVFWSLFGTSNQLLAALTFIGITVWLWRKYRKRWVWFVTGIPTAFMYTFSMWSLLKFLIDGSIKNVVTWVAAVLVGLAILLLIEAVTVIFRTMHAPPIKEQESGTSK